MPKTPAAVKARKIQLKLRADDAADMFILLAVVVVCRPTDLLAAVLSVAIGHSMG